MFCGSASGQMLPAYVVYKSENLWSTWTEGGPKNTRYNRSKSGWFDLTCFRNWFETIFIAHTKHIPGRKCVIGDNLSSHFSESVLRLAKENNIVFLCLPPNSTHLMQPLDVAFYGPLKRHWRAVLDQWKKCAKKSQVVSKDHFPRLLVKLYERLYPNEDETSNNLVSGFRKCGIHPLNAEEVLSRLPDAPSQSSADSNEEQSTVSNTVLEMLKTMRGVDQSPKKKRKKIMVEPGKSISLEDMMCASTSTAWTEQPEVATSSSSDADENPENSSDCLEELEADSTDTEPMEGAEMQTTVPVQSGTYYLIQFRGKKSVKHFIGMFADDAISDADDYQMTFMRSSRKVEYKFLWPDIPDEGSVEQEQIIRALSTPTAERRGGLLFSKAELRPYKNSLQ